MFPTTAQLVHFLEVSKYLSISRAAEALHLSQSALSTSIRKLEQAVGTPLLVRHTSKGVTLTDTGRMIAQRASMIVEELSKLADPSRSESLVGRLRIGVYTPLASRYGVQVLESLRPYCDIERVEIVEGDLQDLTSALSSGRIDWALMYDYGLDDRFQRDHLVSFTPHVIARPGYFGNRDPGEGVSLGEVVRFPFILMDTAHSRNRYATYFNLMGEQPRISRSAVSYELVRAYVAAGYGFSIMHQRASQTLLQLADGIVEYDLNDPLPPISLCLVRYQSSPHANLATRLIEGLGAEPSAA